MQCRVSREKRKKPSLEKSYKVQSTPVICVISDFIRYSDDLLTGVFFKKASQDSLLDRGRFRSLLNGSPNCILFRFVGRQLIKVENHCV